MWDVFGSSAMVVRIAWLVVPGAKNIRIRDESDADSSTAGATKGSGAGWVVLPDPDLSQ